jgi:subtilisin family serine protease
VCQLETAVDSINRLIAPFQPNLEAASDVLIVAAAGNESLNAIDRASARYPAALASVIGVGSLIKTSSNGFSPDTAIYSNISDSVISNSQRRTEQGIAIFGGDVLDPTQRVQPDPKTFDTHVSHPGNSVLGLYTHDSVFDTASETWVDQYDTGYAWWAGTSFAAPAITGLLAQMLTHERLSPQEALNLLYDVHPGPPPGMEQIGIMTQIT